MIKTAEEYKYSSTQFQMPEELCKRLRAFSEENIPEDALFVDEDGGKGREDEFHVTVLYGIKTEESGDILPELEQFLDTKKKIKLGKIDKFRNGDYDVLKVSVNDFQEDLQEIFDYINDNIDNNNEHDDYKAHVTLAYVKAGECEELVGNTEFEDEEIILDHFKFSSSDENKVKFVKISNQQFILQLKSAFEMRNALKLLNSLIYHPFKYTIRGNSLVFTNEEQKNDAKQLFREKNIFALEKKSGIYLSFDEVQDFKNFIKTKLSPKAYGTNINELDQIYDYFGIVQWLSKNSKLEKKSELEFMSDRMRADYASNPMEKIDTDDLTRADDSQLVWDNDFVYVKETPNYIVLTEEWNDECREGLYDKYGDDSDETIIEKLTPRFENIANHLGLQFISHNLEDNKSVVIFKKKNENLKDTISRLRDKLNNVGMNRVFDITTVKDVVERLKTEIQAPFKNFYFSTLGGDSNVSILGSISLDGRESWSGGYIENSSYLKLHILNYGVVESNSGSLNRIKNFRKTKFVNIDQLISKLNKYISDVKELQNNNLNNKMEKKSISNWDERNGGEFVPHGTYTVSNSMGYEVMLSDDGESAKLRDMNGQVTDWLPIEHSNEEYFDADGNLDRVDDELVIDPHGYDIPLNMVMRVQSRMNHLGQVEEFTIEPELEASLDFGDDVDEIESPTESDYDVIVEFDGNSSDFNQSPTRAMEIDPAQSKEIITKQLLTYLSGEYPNSLTYDSIYKSACDTGLCDNLQRYDLIAILNNVATELGLPRIEWSGYFPVEEPIEPSDISGLEGHVDYENNENAKSVEDFSTEFDNESDSLFTYDRMLEERIKNMISPDALIEESYELVKESMKNLKRKNSAVTKYFLRDIKVDDVDTLGRLINGKTVWSVRLKSYGEGATERTIEIELPVIATKMQKPAKFKYGVAEYPLELWYVNSIFEK